MEKKDKKKTLTISSNLKKKIDTSSISSDGKKSFSVEKKKPYKANKNLNKINQSFGQINNIDIKKKNYARKFIEQQATKAFIKKSDKPSGKSKLKLKNPIDKRDLLYVFGLDKKIQKKDYFFHNANSIIRRDIWNKIPFDENVSNVEDRVWGKEVIQRGYNLVYSPDASVYHHHGLHQGNDLKRAEGVISVIDQVDKTTNKDSLPSSLLPGKANIPAIIPVNNSSQLTSSKKRLLDNAISDLAKSTI